MSRSRKQNTQPRQPIDKQTAFLEFKAIESESGPKHEATIRECRSSLKETRNHIRIKTDQCNSIKSKIDKIKDVLDHMTQEKKDANLRQAMSPGTSKNNNFLEAEEEPTEDIIDE